jgi:sugar O-acyltransferase (sialic acid O-acetyltransferase NeuD family)
MSTVDSLHTTAAEPKPLVILGASGFGRELLQWITDINSERATFQPLGFLDDAPGGSVAGLPLLGSLDCVKDYPGVSFVLAVNNPSVRERIVQRLDLPAAAWADIIHPTATRGARCQTGPGLIMCPYSGLSVDIRLGCQAQLNTRAGVGHDADIGDYCTIGPNAIVLGNAVLGNRVSLGANSVVLPSARLGHDVTVGALSTAMRRVRDGVTLFGSPGKRL